MICHQRTVLPNTRLINKAEARGITYERLKGKRVNWCAFAEWTCRNEIRRKDNKEDAQDAHATPVHGISRDGFKQEHVNLFGGRKLSGNFGEVTETMPESSNQRVSTDLRENKSVGEWQEYVSGLERGLPESEEVVRALEKRKELAAMAKVRVDSQVDFGSMMVKTAEDRLRELEAMVEDVRRTRVSEPSNEDLMQQDVFMQQPTNMEEIEGQIELQKKVIESLRMTKMSGPGASDRSLILEEYDTAMELWENALRKMSVWKMHKQVLQEQLRQMRLGFQRPGFFPAPLPFVTLDPADLGSTPITRIDIHECPYCLRGFEPAWDCKIACCKHGYHSWCAWSHFSQSSRCIMETCGMEMHPDWWIMSGIPNPNNPATVRKTAWIKDEGEGNDGVPKGMLHNLVVNFAVNCGITYA